MYTVWLESGQTLIKWETIYNIAHWRENKHTILHNTKQHRVTTFSQQLAYTRQSLKAG